MVAAQRDDKQMQPGEAVEETLFRSIFCGEQLQRNCRFRIEQEVLGFQVSVGRLRGRELSLHEPAELVCAHELELAYVVGEENFPISPAHEPKRQDAIAA